MTWGSTSAHVCAPNNGAIRPAPRRRLAAYRCSRCLPGRTPRTPGCAGSWTCCGRRPRSRSRCSPGCWRARHTRRRDGRDNQQRRPGPAGLAVRRAPGRAGLPAGLGRAGRGATQAHDCGSCRPADESASSQSPIRPRSASAVSTLRVVARSWRLTWSASIPSTRVMAARSARAAPWPRSVSLSTTRRRSLGSAGGRSTPSPPGRPPAGPPPAWTWRARRPCPAGSSRPAPGCPPPGNRSWACPRIPPDPVHPAPPSCTAAEPHRASRKCDLSGGRAKRQQRHSRHRRLLSRLLTVNSIYI